MIKITDVVTLGTEYTITNQNGEFVKTIQILPQDDILSAALGPYTEEFGEYDSYLENSVAVLFGFDKIDPNKIFWYSTSEEEVILADVIEYAVKYDYDVIILEHINPDEE